MSALSSSSIPVSLGKPSLRRRLEDYYSLIAPDQIVNQEEWLGKFDKIAAKFGGSYEGERRLAKKLEAKYGSAVRFLLAESVETDAHRSSQQIAQDSVKQDESWYELTSQESNSGVVDFTSSWFDPVAALMQASEDIVMQANPFLAECPRMDRIDQARSLLPETDPLHRPARVRAPLSASQNDDTSKKKISQRSTIFSPLLESIERKGPFSILHRALEERKRLRVVIRYVNGIRGTLTGHLVAFDKHMNLLLRDVLEVYSLRQTERAYDVTNLEIELKRREHPVRQRHLRNILVRGDNVVLVYFADAEQSVLPRTSKSPKGSIYRKNSPEIGRFGTLGSLMLAQERRTAGKR